MSDQNIDYSQYLNPNYGKGLFRRRIRLAGSDNKVLAELEDTNHGFRATLHHNGQQVVKVEGEAIRIPLTTCGGAVEPLRALEGIALSQTAQEITRQVNPKANCTHLYDLSLLAIAHCQRGNSERLYDLEVEDSIDGQSAESRAYCNGELVLRWQVQQWVLQEGEHAGNSLYKGFSAWANKAFSGDQQEAAFALQKAYFVSQARVFDMDKMAGTRANDQLGMSGVCFSYSPPQVDIATRTHNTTRDFTDSPEQLLKFE